MNFIKFEENNDHEGETWLFWLQVDGNEAELEKLRLLTDQVEGYEVSWGELTEHDIDVLVEHGGWGYMNYHNKVKGKFVCPEFNLDDEPEALQELCDDEFYKGRIEDHFEKE